MKPSINWLLAFIPITSRSSTLASSPAPVDLLLRGARDRADRGLIVRATEQIATRTGDAVGGLLNATFGNAPELIIALVALQGRAMSTWCAPRSSARFWRTCCSRWASPFCSAACVTAIRKYNAGAARVYSTMMLLAAMSLAVPSAFSRYFAPDGTMRQEQLLNIGVAGRAAVRLRAVPGVLAQDASGRFRKRRRRGGEEHHARASTGACRGPSASLVGASVLAAWMSEILVGAAEGTGQALGMSQMFIGIVFLAIVGGAAESGSAIAMARKNKMDLSLGIALGSSIQIALFVAPVLVFASYFIAPEPLELSFTPPRSARCSSAC